MFYATSTPELETKFRQFDTETGLKNGAEISGYASIFGALDKGGDEVRPGAYQASLKALAKAGRKVKMLWQHEPNKPIGVWEEVREDKTGLYVHGHILADVQAGAEALALIKAGAIDGLSIGYRTIRAEKCEKGRRLLHELELWEVSLVTFPMLPEARLTAEPTADDQLAQDLVEAISSARQAMLS